MVQTNDGEFATATSATLTVLQEDNPGGAPLLVTVLLDTLVDSGHAFAFEYEAEDPDGDDIHFRLLEAPQGASFDESTGLFSWAASASGVFGVVVSVRDFPDSSVVTRAVGGRGIVCPRVGESGSLIPRG